MNNETNISRNSQIDIMRALSMFMIIICHFIYHGIRHVVEEDTFPDLGFSASLTGEINFFFCQLLGYLTNTTPKTKRIYMNVGRFKFIALIINKLGGV